MLCCAWRPFDVRILQKTPPGPEEDSRTISFPPSGCDKGPCRQRPLTRIAGGIPTQDSDDVVRRLIVAQNPEFTPSWREPAPVNQNISDDFLMQGNTELLEFHCLNQPVRCTGCQLKHRPVANWCGNCKKLVPNVADNAKEERKCTSNASSQSGSQPLLLKLFFLQGVHDILVFCAALIKE